MSPRGGEAIVMGASMGGLLAARVLADYFDLVTLVERDELSDEPAPRKGVPQSRHTHGLLARGGEALEGLFPGIVNDLVAKGALTGDLLGKAYWFNHGVYLKASECGLAGLLTTRPVLEAEVRSRVMQLPNVRLRVGRPVQELVFQDGEVKGVRIRSGSDAGEMLADLVVDSTGRGSRSPAWLEAMGYARPPEEVIEVNVAYMTREYRRSPEQLNGKLAVIMAGCAPEWRTAAMLAPDKDRWMVSLGGFLGERVPEDDAGYLEFARSLRKPEIYDVLRVSEPLTPPVPYMFSSNQRRRYEKLSRFPEGYLVFGDALAASIPFTAKG